MVEFYRDPVAEKNTLLGKLERISTLEMQPLRENPLFCISQGAEKNQHEVCTSVLGWNTSSCKTDCPWLWNKTFTTQTPRKTQSSKSLVRAARDLDRAILLLCSKVPLQGKPDTPRTLAVIFIEVEKSWLIKCSPWSTQCICGLAHTIYTTHINITRLWATRISNTPRFIWNMLFVTSRIYGTGMLKKPANFCFLFLSPCLVQFTRTHTWDDDINSTYSSSPFHASSLSAFPAHLKQDHLQLFFQPRIAKAKVSLKRTRASLSNTAPDILRWLELAPAPPFGFWFSWHFQICLPVYLHVIALEFYQFLVSKKHFTENRDTQRISKCQERKLWHWKITNHPPQIS